MTRVIAGNYPISTPSLFLISASTHTFPSTHALFLYTLLPISLLTTLQRHPLFAPSYLFRNPPGRLSSLVCGGMQLLRGDLALLALGCSDPLL